MKNKTPAKKVKTIKSTKTAAAAKKPAKILATQTNSKSFSKINFTPLQDRLVVEVQGESDKTAGGLFIPGTVTNRPSRGIVLSVGRGKRSKKGQLRPMDVKVGDSVVFAEFAGVKTTLNNKEVLLLSEEEVLGIVG